MGRKTNPIIMRVGNVLRTWDGKWFSDRRVNYRANLLSDLAIRKYFAQVHRTTSISKMEIERNQQETVLTIHTSRPAMVIGRGGSGIEKIQKDLRRKLKIKRGGLRINVQEVRNPDTDAAAVATQVVEQIERRFPFRRVLKQAVQRARQAGALGVRVLVSGRLNGAEIARREWLGEGNVPLHTFRADISYANKVARTTYGAIGVKVWINRGELKAGGEEEDEVKVKERRVVKQTKRTSLAKAAKASAKIKTSREDK
jgi:small subunit ribosomal protein S3